MMPQGMRHVSRHPGNPWNVHMDAALADLWRDGLTVRAIAAELSRRFGVTVTANAVVGRRRRLDIPGRPSPILTTPPGGSSRRPRTHGGAPLAPGAVPAPALERTPDEVREILARLAQLPRVPGVQPVGRPRCCQWPIGEPGAPGFHFCAQPLARQVPGKPVPSYCGEHMGKAWVRPGRPAPGAVA